MKNRAFISLFSFLLVFFSFSSFFCIEAYSEDQKKTSVIMTPPYEWSDAHANNINLPDNDELLVEYMEKAALEKTTPAKRGASVGFRGAKLTGINASAYTILRASIEKIAAGELNNATIPVPIRDLTGGKISYSADDLGVDELVVNGEISEDAAKAFLSLTSFDLDKVLDALLYDLPFDFYWFDKSFGVGSSQVSYGVYDTTEGTVMAFADTDPVTYFSFYVSKDYSKTGEIGTTDTDPEKTGAAKKAASNAAAVVVENADNSDLNKLSTYKEYICSAVSYDFDALNENTDYGDPWQIIFVFDNDETTNVVCEGYSKAFQFLCDLSEFNSGIIKCRTVTGNITSEDDPGNHMWNIMHMEDRNNYLVDITNCDGTAVGSPDKLFLAAAVSGDVQSGYEYSCGDKTVSYVYDNSCLNTYSARELLMSHDQYTEGVPYTCGHEKEYVSEKPVTCTDAGNKAYYYCPLCEKYFDQKGREVEPEDYITGPTGHSVRKYRAKEPTCTQAGNIEYYQCLNCGKYYHDSDCDIEMAPGDRITPPTGHNMTEKTTESTSITYWHCSKCGKDFDDINGSNTIKIVDYSFRNGVLTFSGTGSLMSLPSANELEKPWNIYQKTAKKIVIEEGITGICDCAFRFFENVTEVSVPDSVGAIGDEAFKGCSKLEEFEFPDNMYYYGANIFYNCTSLKHVRFGSDYYFDLASWPYPEISHSNFFKGASNLERIDVAEDNLFFRAIDGVLYLTLGDGKLHLICYPMTKKDSMFNIPDNVETLCMGAFSGNRYLKTININEGMLAIDNFAFMDLPLLEKIEIPSSVVHMDSLYDYIKNTDKDPARGIFSNCVNLRTIVNNSDTNTVFGKDIEFDNDGRNYVIFWKSSDTGRIVSSMGKGTATKVRYWRMEEGDVINQNKTRYVITDIYRSKDGWPKMDEITPEELNAGIPVGMVIAERFSNDAVMPSVIKYGGWTFDVSQSKALSVDYSTVSRMADKTYTGKAICPSPTVKLNGRILIKDTDYSISYKNNKKTGKAHVVIKGKGKYSGSITEAFNIIPKGTGIKRLKAAKKVIIVNWVKRSTRMPVKRIKGYQIQLATNKAFSGNVKTVNVRGYSKVSKKISGLKSKRKYYVRIRTYMRVAGKTYYSKWSSCKTIKTK